MTIVRDAEILTPTRGSNVSTVVNTIHNADTIRVAIPSPSVDLFAGNEYPETAAPAELKSVAKALALIAGAVVVIGAALVAGVAFLTTPLPEHTVVRPAAMFSDTKPTAVTPTQSMLLPMVAAPVVHQK